MDRWEHMLVTTEKSGAVSQLVARSALGPQDSIPQTGLTDLLGFLDKQGGQGWELINVETTGGVPMCWLRRPIPEGRSRNW